jgi:hypothetical protein
VIVAIGPSTSNRAGSSGEEAVAFSGAVIGNDLRIERAPAI